MAVSNEFCMAGPAFHISSRNTTLAVGRYPSMARSYLSNSLSRLILIGPNISSGALYPGFSIWNVQKKIGGIFRRDAELNAPLLRHKMKGKSRMMNKIQAKELYEKMFANYPDVLTVEDATKLLGFKSQTAVIRRVHQHRIRCLKVGRSFMIPKEYLIDYLLDD